MRGFVLTIILLTTPSWAAPKTCGADINKTGACHGNQVVWCEDSEVQTLECKAGSVCAWNEELNAFDCIPVLEQCTAPLGDEQDAVVPLTGVCDNTNNRVLWCKNGQVKTLECSEGKSCGWNDGIKMMDCTDLGCGTISPAGVCTENTLRWCEDGTIQEKNCKPHETCAFDEGSSLWRCLESPEVATKEPKDTKDTAKPVITPPTYGSRSEPPQATINDNEEPEPAGCQASNKTKPTAPLLLVILLACIKYWRIEEQPS